MIRIVYLLLLILFGVVASAQPGNLRSNDNGSFMESSMFRIDLRNKHLKTLEVDVEAWQNVKVLDLSGNDFTMLPRELSELPALEEIYLNNEPMLNMQQAFSVLSNVERLKTLHLDNYQRLRIPDNIRFLTNLEELTLRDAGIREVPKPVLQLKKLKTLDLTGNPIYELPKNITALGRLRVLRLPDNGSLYNERTFNVLGRMNRLNLVTFGKTLDLQESFKHGEVPDWSVAQPVVRGNVVLGLQHPKFAINF